MDDDRFMRGSRGTQLLAAAVIVVAAAMGIAGDPRRAHGQDGRATAPVIEGTIQATENEYVGEALAVNAAAVILDCP